MALVMKVKYGGTLRRFSVHKREDGSVDLSLDALRSKIQGLFKLNPEAQLILTYTDEDNDVVTMADDDDLLDALHQNLCPLRLEVAMGSRCNRRSRTEALLTEFFRAKKSSIPREQDLDFDSKITYPDESFKKRVDRIKGFDEPIKERQCAFKSRSDFLPKTATTTPMNDQGNQVACSFQPASQNRSHPSALPTSGEGHGNGSNKNLKLGENMTRTSLKSVQCHSCQMNPIGCPRCESTMTKDCYLCCNRFCERGNDSEHTRINRPLYRPPWSEGSFPGTNPCWKDSCSFQCNCSPRSPYSKASSIGGPACKSLGKLDSRFVRDVTIFDGTQLNPGTRFTKIWCLRNNGTVQWPPYTQLQRVGGDKLGAGDVVDIGIHEQGWPVNEELDIAVEFIAPMQPGYYASHWCLTTPTGQSFGQQVWVLIQVETPREDMLRGFSGSPLTKDPSPYISLQLPLEKVDSKMSAAAETSASGSTFSTSVKTVPVQDAYEALALCYGTPALTWSEICLPLSSPFCGAIKEQDIKGVKQPLLPELRGVCFNQIAMNAEVFEKNNYDSQKTVDNSCSAIEWDTIMEDLEELGFFEHNIVREE